MIIATKASLFLGPIIIQKMEIIYKYVYMHIGIYTVSKWHFLHDDDHYRASPRALYTLLSLTILTALWGVSSRCCGSVVRLHCSVLALKQS